MPEPKVDIEASLKLIEAATEWPWKEDCSLVPDTFPSHTICVIHRHRSVMAAIDSNSGPDEWRANTAFIVAARDPIAGWEAALKELRDLREAYADAHRDATEWMAKAIPERRDGPVKMDSSRLAEHSSRVAACECKARVLSGTEKFCPDCGRKLEWSTR